MVLLSLLGLPGRGSGEHGSKTYCYLRPVADVGEEAPGCAGLARSN